MHGHSPSQRLFQRVMAATFMFFLINSVSLTEAYDSGGYYSEAYDYLAIEDDTNIISDDEGYIVKINTPEGQARYTNRGKETVQHEIQPGDTLSVIAYRYDLNMESIQWANPGIGAGHYLKVGNEITIPPEDGIEVKVKKGDNWEKLITKYKTEIEESELIAWNEMPELVEGEKVFLLGGRQPYVAPIATNTRSTGYTPTGVKPTVNVVPVPGGWVRPTVGKLTQGYHWGHYAYDIADTSRPGIVAARAGTVERAENSGWNGGYGNVVIIDHGDGYKTLYAHNQEVYVTPGEYVGQGQVIAKMGNTGRVYGRTGIHLHFELHYNGTKLNPAPVWGW
jgi:murein DD-endopeptidase MepM/ murein hydrolase activator NlpD